MKAAKLHVFNLMYLLGEGAGQDYQSRSHPLCPPHSATAPAIPERPPLSAAWPDLELPPDSVLGPGKQGVGISPAHHRNVRRPSPHLPFKRRTQKAGMVSFKTPLHHALTVRRGEQAPSGPRDYGRQPRVDTRFAGDGALVRPSPPRQRIPHDLCPRASRNREAAG